MAVTITKDGVGAGGKRVKALAAKPLGFATGVIAFDSAYPTGGEDVADICGDFTEVLGGFFPPKDGYVFEFDVANQKVKVMYGDYSNAGDGVLVELPNDTDIATVVAVEYLIWGYGVV